ncbi:MAG: ribonuclease R [Desulfopila sp.]
MVQKRFKPKRARRPPRRRLHTVQTRQPANNLENAVLAFLYQAAGPASLAETARATTGKRTVGRELKAALTALLQEKCIVKLEKKRYAIHPAAPLYTGTLQQNPRGFGFVLVSGRQGNAPELQRDVYIGAARLGEARHGDRVLLRLLGAASSARPEGSIIEVLERGPDTIAGFFQRQRRGAFVYPEDTRYPFIIQVDPASTETIDDNMVVIARINPEKLTGGVISGAIVEVLGPADSIDVQMRLVIEKFRLPHIFNPASVAEAAAFDEAIPADSDREDLRELLHVTIDGETAKDFDDAIFVTRTETGYRLHVSIADVGHFVRPGSAIDKDAYQRGTSIYFPGRVIPMLPERLSNDLCSLIPDRDRLTVTAIIDFAPDGHRRSARFCRSVIRSHCRFTYTTVRKILIDRDQAIRDDSSRFLPMLEVARELAEKLLDLRRRRGSIGFSLPEPAITLESDGSIRSIERAERNFAHQIIEEFMLAANEAVAETFTRKKRKGVFRIHELPDFAKVSEFATFAKSLGLHLPPPTASPEWFAQVVTACRGSDKEYIVNNLLLRTMQQARYAADNVGHFALATENYTHFTSPIRRYPDLIVHRGLCRMLVDGTEKEDPGRTSGKLEEKADFLSERERTVTSAEREMDDRLKMLYMAKHLDEDFPAIISGVTDFAVFVELLDLFISGAIPLEVLGDEHFLFDSKHYRVIGEISATTYQLGDTIRVTASEIDRKKNRIVFRPSVSQ